MSVRSSRSLSDAAGKAATLVEALPWLERFRDALGDAADEPVLDTLLLAFFGAMLQTGMGLSSYPQMADRLDDAIAAAEEEFAFASSLCTSVRNSAGVLVVTSVACSAIASRTSV